MKRSDNTKTRILSVANELFYQQGFGNTSIQDIVNKIGLSKGNITYHFKSKQSILEAVVDQRLSDIKQLLATWDKDIPTPQGRIERFCDVSLNEKDSILLYGCPMGTLTSELSKNEPELYQITLPMFKYFNSWLIKQFELLGYSNNMAAEKALSLLSRIQGIALISNVFRDSLFLEREIGSIKANLPFEC